MAYRLAYLGPPGTNGELAAIQFDAAAERVPFPSHAAVAAAVEAGDADAGVVAIENLINGSVQETLDILIHETTLTIQAELLLPIEHTLVVRPGTRLADIAVVLSHPQALGQCRRFLQRELPGAAVVAALSTTEAVQQVMRRPGDAAAIATARAAEIEGAAILARDIQDTDNNVTRFLVLGRGHPAPTGRDRTSVAFTFDDDRAGALASVLDVFAREGISCSKIESRPTKATFGEYVFLVDFEGHRDDEKVREVLAEVRALCSELMVFGSYPRAQGT